MYQKILVGADGSKTAAKAVDRAVDLAKATGATLTILTAARADKGHEIVAQEGARHADSGVAIDLQVVEEDAVSALINTAERGGYDLLVMGNKGMTGVTRYFRLGSVPNKVTHHLPCTLLIVKTT
jgi:nucleotide-binding universal stress UspA family protein